MCLAVPMEVTSIEDNVARIEVGGVKNEVRLDIIDEQPQVGDFVIVHADLPCAVSTGRKVLRP